MGKFREKMALIPLAIIGWIKRARTSTKIFYTALLVIILLGVIGISIVTGNVKDWLIRYEASQPDNQSQAIFSDLFIKPNWSRIFELSGEPSDDQVNAKNYAKFMENKVGDTPLSYIETSAGLSGNKKYIVRAGSEKVATFTLSNSTPNAEIPTWTLEDVEIFYTRDVFVNIITPGYRVMVDGVYLTAEDVVRTDITKAEKYLPDGVLGDRECLITLDGFMTEPTVKVIDERGKTVEMAYDADTHTYTLAHKESPQLTADSLEYQALVTAAKTYCEYMIEEATQADLALYFDVESNIYKTITAGDNWVQKNKGHDFSEETITSYYRYTDNLYSAKIQLTMNVYRTDNTVKTYELDHTIFMEKKDKTWLVTNLINGDVQERQTKVRLTYQNEGETLASEMVFADSDTLTPPTVTVPEGKTFLGWFVEKKADNGKIVMELVFDPPSEDGQIHLPKNTILEPMVLHARFE